MTFFLRGRVKASSQRVSSPATEKHQDICTIPLAAFDPVSWLHRQGCSPSGKEKNCFNTPKAKSSKHPIFGVFFVWINFWKFPHLPIEIMESLGLSTFSIFFPNGEVSDWWSMGYFHTPTFGILWPGHRRTFQDPHWFTTTHLGGFFPRFFWVLMFFESGCDSVGHDADRLEQKQDVGQILHHNFFYELASHHQFKDPVMFQSSVKPGALGAPDASLDLFGGS